MSESSVALAPAEYDPKDPERGWRGVADIDTAIPCPLRDRVIQSTDGHTVICCKYLSEALGWWHAVTSSMCVKCAAYHGVATDLRKNIVKWKRDPQRPTAQGEDPLSKHYQHMMLHPLRVAMSESELKRVLNFTRDECIARAKQEGVDKQVILQALVLGVRKSKLDPRYALKLAEAHQLVV